VESMKRNKHYLLFIVFSIGGLVRADWQDVWFNSDATITDGQQYVRVFANGTTNLNITGGQIGSLFCGDNTKTKVSGGTFRSSYYSYHPENNDGDNLFLAPSKNVVISSSAVVDILGGDLETVSCSDSGIANIFNGQFDVDFTDNSTINIFGGEITIRSTLPYFPPSSINSSIINLYGGAIARSVQLLDKDQMNVYGYGFNYDPQGGDYGNPKVPPGGSLSGYWSDGSYFKIDFGGQSYNKVVLHEIPEPNGFVLMGLSFLFLKSRR